MKEINPKDHTIHLFTKISSLLMQSEKCTVNIPACWHSLQAAENVRPFIKQVSSGWRVFTGARGWHFLWGFAIWESTGEEHKHERCFEGIMSFPFHRDISCHPIVRSRAPIFLSQHTTELRQILISNGRKSPLCADMYMLYLHLKGALPATTRTVTPSNCTFKFYNC